MFVAAGPAACVLSASIPARDQSWDTCVGHLAAFSGLRSAGQDAARGACIRAGAWRRICTFCIKTIWRARAIPAFMMPRNLHGRGKDNPSTLAVGGSQQGTSHIHGMACTSSIPCIYSRMQRAG